MKKSTIISKSVAAVILMSASIAANGQNTASEARCKVLELNKDEKFINFAFVTDVHGAAKSPEDRFAQENLEHFVEVCNEKYCDFAAFGGDLYSAYDASRQEAFDYLSVAMGWFNQIQIPLYMTKGNHDCNGKLTQEETISKTQYHLLCHKRLDSDSHVKFNPEDPYGNYFLADYPLEKVRVITLNNYDLGIMQEGGIHDAQLKWLRETALKEFDGPGWTVIMLTHNLEQEGGEFWSVIDEFNSNGDASIAAIIYGHNHFDRLSKSHGVNLIDVTCGYATKAQAGTAAADAFSIFTIDTRNRQVIETRVGRGRDRIVEF